MQKFFLSLMLFFFFSLSTQAAEVFDKNKLDLSFAIVQDTFIFNHASIASATIIEIDGVYKGLAIKLKPNFALQLKKMTEAAIQKRALLIVNDKVISSAIIQNALSNEMLIAGIPKPEAQAFIETLKIQDYHNPANTSHIQVG